MLRVMLLMFGFSAVVLLLGFAAFLMALPKTQNPRTMAQAEAIVVLTGGGGTRINAAAQLLAMGRGQRLLISGVHSTVQRNDIQELFNLTPDIMRCCVDLGYRARDTLGNADEIASWAQSHHYQHLIVVTSTYHMPRSLIELRTSLPTTQLTPFPVEISQYKGVEKWRKIMVEYLKYIVILAREALLGIGEH